jgi:hypothetical protein
MATANPLEWSEDETALEAVEPADDTPGFDPADEPADDGGAYDVPAEQLRARARTISIKRLSKRELEHGRALYPDVDIERPQTRGDCAACPGCQAWRDGGAGDERPACGHSRDEAIRRSRPCVFVACKHSLYLDVSESTGSIKLNRPDVEPGDVDPDVSCAMDIADRGGITLEEVGAAMSLTRERIRQYETRSLERLRPLMPDEEFEHGDHATRSGLRFARGGGR